MDINLLFCNISYMKYYEGITELDCPYKGGSYVENKKDAMEKYNFKAEDGIVRGFVETNHYKNKPNQLHIEKINKNYSKSDRIENVTVVFCATAPKRGRIIVGWYKNATVFRHRQVDTYFESKNEYNIYTSINNVFLIKEQDRSFPIPKGKYYFGRSNLWYAQNAKDFVKTVLEYINEMETQPNSDEYIDNVYNNTMLTPTERDTLIKARICQGKFRKDLLNRDNACRICKIRNEKLLIASHIKPWAKSEDKERKDPENGLLLCVMHDALFDKHLITFDEEGKILISGSIKKDDFRLLNVETNIQLNLSPQMNAYMAEHRKEFYLQEETRKDL